MATIFIHGLGQTPRSWEGVLSHLSPGQETVFPDLAQLLLGKTADYQHLYEAFCSVCDGLTPPLDLCGLSLGGVLALHYAALHPIKVRSLVLIGAQYRMPRGLLTLQNALFRLMPEKLFQDTGLDKQSFLTLCTSMMELDFTTQLKDVRCPVLVLCGEKDSANRKAARELAEKLPSARLQMIPGAGHEVNTGAPAALAAHLRTFWQR